MSGRKFEGGVRPPEGKAELLKPTIAWGHRMYIRLGRWGMDCNPVFIVSAVAVVLFVAYALVFQDQASSFFDGYDQPDRTFDAFSFGQRIFLFCSVWRWWLAWGGVRLGGSEAVDFGCRLVCHAVCRGHGHWFDVLGCLNRCFIWRSELLGVPSPIAAMAQSSKKR